MSQKKIRILTSVPGLQDKIITNITEDADTIYWYIKFNIPLDPSTVSHKTMNVTDTDGYIMKTEITYDITKNLILISPVDSYEQNRYYLLNISKKVKSEKGKSLNTKVHILFKLLNNQISDYKVLKKETKIPKPKPRHRNYDTKKVESRVYDFQKTTRVSEQKDKLPLANIHINVLLGIIGVIVVGLGLFIKSTPLTILGTVVCAIGFLYIIKQLLAKNIRSAIMYNAGVFYFNRERYEKAQRLFEKGFDLDPQNEYCEYARHKITYYF